MSAQWWIKAGGKQWEERLRTPPFSNHPQLRFCVEVLANQSGQVRHAA